MELVMRIDFLDASSRALHLVPVAVVIFSSLVGKKHDDDGRMALLLLAALAAPQRVARG